MRPSSASSSHQGRRTFIQLPFASPARSVKSVNSGSPVQVCRHAPSVLKNTDRRRVSQLLQKGLRRAIAPAH